MWKLYICVFDWQVEPEGRQMIIYLDDSVAEWYSLCKILIVVVWNEVFTADPGLFPAHMLPTAV